MKIDAESGDHRYYFVTLLILNQELDISLILFLSARV